MSETVTEQLQRGERAEGHVQALLANERSLLLEIERLTALTERYDKLDLERIAEIERLKDRNAELRAALNHLKGIACRP